MRSVAKKLRDQAEKLTDELVEIRRDDKHLRDFHIPMQKNLEGACASILDLAAIRLPPGFASGDDIRPLKLGPVTVHKDFRLRLIGPNGVGKTTVLKALVDEMSREKLCSVRDKSLRIGYYSQDFSDLDLNKTVIEALRAACQHCDHSEQHIRHVAANFFFTGPDMMKQKLVTLSEGQKGLLQFACLVLSEPGLLVLDEPTNHINFRHIPAIAKAISAYEGGVIMVSHDMEFLSNVRIDREIDLYYDVVR